MHAVMISFRCAGTEDNRDGVSDVFPPTPQSLPGLMDSYLLQNGPRQAWFLLFRDRRSAELALRTPAITRLRRDPSRGNIFVEQFETLERSVDVEQPSREANVLVAEQPVVAAQ